MSDFPEKMMQARDALERVINAENQIATNLHMVSDGMDVIVDTSDGISGLAEGLKERAQILQELTELLEEDGTEVLSEIMAIITECSQWMEDIEASVQDYVGMSHDIQNVVRNIAVAMDENVEDSGEVLERFQALTEESALREE